MKTITVRGTGKLAKAPDWIEIHLSVTTTNADYNQAMKDLNFKSYTLYDEILYAGFQQDDLKTVDFSVNSEYESYHDSEGNYRNRFKGYRCNHSYIFAFGFDTKKLALALKAVGNSNVDPEFNISFTIKDTSKINAELLKNITNNAKEKATLLAQASGCKLGSLQNIDCNSSNMNLYSNSRFYGNNMLKQASIEEFDTINPQDVTISDSANFTWELLD